ncbi:imelysin family protein [Microbulbifer sp. YPW16]|uniref:imelysin family protein n=1 Tax=Microbulbifer sp. YPW16 TaxID=2904242 RepID=UPI001E37D0CF|nr:imelysin family protein [Microbulbifer sp. YPW16]UHQ56966.1 imelysin [Microbulbifer sp. YPW16]
MTGSIVLKRVSAALAILLGLGLAGCDSRRAEEPQQEAPAVKTPPAIDRKVAERFSHTMWQAGEAQLIDVRASVEALNRALTTLLDRPSEDHLESAKLAWLDAHREFAAALPYIQLAFAPAELRDEGRELVLSMDSWPVQPGYLDTVPGYSESGIVNDTAVELTLANLRRQHRLTAHEEASTGFHALEIMLWGPTSERSADQFQAASAGEQPEALAANRRRQLTRLMGEALAEDLAGLERRWPFTMNDLSRHFLALDPVARLQQVRASHLRTLDEELLRRLPESSESDVESGRAADSKQAILAMLGSLEAAWVPNEGPGLADLLLDPRQREALAERFEVLEELLLKMEDPVELAELGQLARARELLEEIASLMSGRAEIPAGEDEVTPVSLTTEQ